MDGIENCTLINKVSMSQCKIKYFTKIGSLQNLSTFYNFGPVNIDKLIDGLSKCSNLKDVTIRDAQLNNMERMRDLKMLISYHYYLKIENYKFKKLRINDKIHKNYR